MTPKRLLLTLLLALAAVTVFVPGASAGNFDEEKMGCSGEDPATCPTGTEGQPYSLTIYLSPPDGGRGEDFGCATFHHTSGSFPPGLSVSSEGTIHGTPTQAGKFEFYLTVKYDKDPGCAKSPSDDRFIININPGKPVLPKLTIGPEQSGVPIGTVGSAYALQMTANLPEAKTWSIVDGALPAGVGINASTGMISGSPTTAGTYPFTVLAVLDAERSDTKALTIVVRDRVTIVPQLVAAATIPNQLLPSEVGRPYVFMLTATGGTQAYSWALSSGLLPQGVRFANGRIWGRPRVPGAYPFTITVTDTEGRMASFNSIMDVAARIQILRLEPMTPAQVGQRYSWLFTSDGGVEPTLWRIARGPLPRGIRLDRVLGMLSGVPKKAGRYRFRIQVQDELGVKSTKTFLLKVAPAPKKAKKKTSR